MKMYVHFIVQNAAESKVVHFRRPKKTNNWVNKFAVSLTWRNQAPAILINWRLDLMSGWAIQKTTQTYKRPLSLPFPPFHPALLLEGERRLGAPTTGGSSHPGFFFASPFGTNICPGTRTQRVKHTRLSLSAQNRFWFDLETDCVCGDTQNFKTKLPRTLEWHLPAHYTMHTLVSVFWDAGSKSWNIKMPGSVLFLDVAFREASRAT